MRCLYLVVVFVLVPIVRLEYSNLTGPPGNLVSSPCTDQNHLLLAPGVLTAGVTNRACVSRFHPEGPAELHLSLVTEDGHTVTAERGLPPGDGGCIDISVPLLPNSKADLVASVKYTEVKCTWERRITLRISSGRVVVVWTERSRYRPGETLRARVLALKADLTPAHGTIDEIWIEGPPGAWEGTRVAQWTRVRSKMGMASIQHEIDELAPPGKWSVRARLGDGSQGSASFWVGNYELPPFQLSVRHAPRVLRTSERLVWTVCVRYPWTEAVEGMLVIRLRGAGSSSPGVRTAVRLRAPRACHKHAAAARRVGLGGDRPPSVIVADFSFQEEGTRIWQNTTVVSQVVDEAISLAFVTKLRSVVTPGLPYKLKVKATRWDDKPAPNERVRVCRYPSLGELAAETNTPACHGADTDASGVAAIMFASEDDGSPFYRFEASLSNDTSIKSAPLVLATQRSKLQAALGPLRADSRGTRTFVPLYLNLQNVTSPVTVHFVVIIRGGIIYRWGATTQCPISSSTNHVHTAPRHGKCNEALPLIDDKNRSNFDKNNPNYDKISDYFNRIISRQQNARNVDKTKSKSENSNDNFNKNNNVDRNSGYFDRYKNQSNRNKNVVDRNMNQNRLNDYFSRYISQNNISSNFNTNKSQDRTYSRNTVSLEGNKNIYDGSTESTEKSQNDVNGFDEGNASDSLLDRHLLRVMLPIKVTQQMCPDSHLIAYFYHNGEFVSASKHFEMDDCFVNKVDLTWQSRQILPGSTTTLQISTPGPALCALMVLDSAAKWTPVNTVRDVIISGLKKMMDGHRNLTEYDAAGDCFLNADTFDLPSNSLELTATWLASAGVRTVGDMPLRRQCNPAALIEERSVPRSDFSEAWLWRLVTVGANGSVTTTAKAPDSVTRFEANAVCLSKNGVAVSQPTVLQVFREFFIHADSPRRLRRGDKTIIRYRLFNYLYEPLSIQIQILTDPHLQGPTDLVESVCVPPRASTARRVEVTAPGQGEGRVSIRAKAVSDGGCGNITNGRGVSDEVVITITVEPEGVPVQEQKSALLCGKDTSNTLSSKSEVEWSWSPVEAVPGTESLTVWAIGNITGPLLADADSLVLLPRGCGEQNMARLATNLLALSHLHPTCAAYASAREHVARGFNRQLQYIHPSGGFSAFGPSDAASSTWLTAFSLRYLRRAHQTLWPDLPIPPAVDRAERWLLAQQMENGCFRNEGQVFHRELRGGLNEDGEIASVALTAYVVTSLIESTSPLPSRVVANTLACLRALPPLKYKTPARIYAHSLLAYAFMRLKRYEEEVGKSNEASWLVENSLKSNEELIEVMELVKMARKEGDYLWWETSSLSTSVEATSYALLALRESPPALREFGAGAVRWLAAHRSAAGGFVSTQDTLVALEALSSWSSVQQSPANLTASARAGSKASAVDIQAGMMIPEVMKMEGDRVHIQVEGTGCALVQATRRYHTLAAPRAQHQRLSVQVAVHTDGEFDCDSSGNCFCAAVVEACVLWTGLFPEMALLEVALPGGYEADAKRLYSQLHRRDSLVRRIELSPGSSRATFYLSGAAGARAHACVSVHAVGPRTDTRAAAVRLIDYYHTSVNDTQTYTIPEECPARIAHDSGQELKDNIFSKARSLSDSGEILINHDFTFEDIPEGIPLEDPLYDNLTRRKDMDDLKKADIETDFTNTNVNITKENDETMSSSDDHFNANNEESKIVNENRNEITAHDHEIHATIGSNIIIDDKLDLSDDDQEIKQNYNVETQNSFTLQNNDSERNERIGEDSLHKVISNADNVEGSKQANEANNQVNEGSFNHRIEIRDDKHENHRVDNPNLSNFHVIDSEKDLEVPSGIEGPVPSIVLPPPNFIPPPNYVRAPENFLNPQNYEAFENFGPLVTPAPIVDNDGTIAQYEVPFAQNRVLSPQKFVASSQNVGIVPRRYYAPDEYRWQGDQRYFWSPYPNHRKLGNFANG